MSMLPTPAQADDLVASRFYEYLMKEGAKDAALSMIASYRAVIACVLFIGTACLGVVGWLGVSKYNDVKGVVDSLDSRTAILSDSVTRIALTADRTIDSLQRLMSAASVSLSAAKDLHRDVAAVASSLTGSSHVLRADAAILERQLNATEGLTVRAIQIADSARRLAATLAPLSEQVGALQGDLAATRAIELEAFRLGVANLRNELVGAAGRFDTILPLLTGLDLVPQGATTQLPDAYSLRATKVEKNNGKASVVLIAPTGATINHTFTTPGECWDEGGLPITVPVLAPGFAAIKYPLLPSKTCPQAEVAPPRPFLTSSHR